MIELHVLKVDILRETKFRLYGYEYFYYLVRFYLLYENERSVYL